MILLRFRVTLIVAVLIILSSFAFQSPYSSSQSQAGSRLLNNTQVYLPLILKPLDPNFERKILLKGVSHVPVPAGAVPGPIALFEAQAFPVIVGLTSDNSQASVVAASMLGLGRIVAFGHGNYFSSSALNSADTGQLVLNSVLWISNQQSSKIAVYNQIDLLNFLQQHGIQSQAITTPITADKLQGFQALALDPSNLSSDAELETIKAFTNNGAGLLTTGLGWGWQYLNPGGNISTDHFGNRLLATAGIGWTNGSFLTKEFTAQVDLDTTLNAFQALSFLNGVSSDSSNTDIITRAEAAILLALPVLPPSNKSILPTLQRYQSLASTIVPTNSNSFSPLHRPLERLGFRLLTRQPVEAITAHPAGFDFPGSVPSDAPRITRTEVVDTRIPKWHSTGIYAAPGEKLIVDIPTEIAATKKLSIRIGTHTDELWKRDSWIRAPQIERTFSLINSHTIVANAFGGMVYVVVPDGIDLGIVSVNIAGGIAAPHFVLGETDLIAWQTLIRYYPAPWAELESNNLIITIQSDNVRNFDNPQTVLQFWDRVQDANLDLARWELGRDRPMRMSFDREFSSPLPSMQSGYPIMALLSSQPNALKPNALKITPAGVLLDDAWGFFHELGHNHQNPDWTFDGTTEVTGNLFTMYAIERVLGIPKEKGHQEISRDAQTKHMKGYFCSGTSFDQWKSDPFLALTMYIQLVDSFGWDSFKTVFQEYNQLSESERPKNDDQKRDQWLVRYSKTVGKNLGSFFDAWGIPTSSTAKQSIVSLPVWMPAPNFPSNISCQ